MRHHQQNEKGRPPPASIRGRNGAETRSHNPYESTAQAKQRSHNPYESTAQAETCSHNPSESTAQDVMAVS